MNRLKNPTESPSPQGTNRKWWETDSCSLHILAMLFMLCDHTWSALLPKFPVLTCIGRIAFPIFAFMTAEGYFRTRNFRAYLKRMLVFALISEIPFNLLYSGSIIYPFHQNVIWTFLITLIGMRLMDRIKAMGKTWLTICGCAGITLACTILGYVCFTDYYGIGVLMVFTFYFFHERKWWCYIGQFLVLYYLNVEILGGFYYDISIADFHLELVRQGLALLALIPIWLYRGRQGYHSKGFQYFCYAFYPAHMLILVILGHILF